METDTIELATVVIARSLARPSVGNQSKAASFYPSKDLSALSVAAKLSGAICRWAKKGHETRTKTTSSSRSFAFAIRARIDGGRYSPRTLAISLIRRSLIFANDPICGSKPSTVDDPIDSVQRPSNRSRGTCIVSKFSRLTCKSPDRITRRRLRLRVKRCRSMVVTDYCTSFNRRPNGPRVFRRWRHHFTNLASIADARKCKCRMCSETIVEMQSLSRCARRFFSILTFLPRLPN